MRPYGPDIVGADSISARGLMYRTPSGGGRYHLQFLLSVVLVVRFVVFCWVRLVVLRALSVVRLVVRFVELLV